VAKVTIAVPCYNEERYIEETLRSLMAQSDKEIEIIVCDNASTDSTAEIVQRLIKEDGRISLSAASTNIGGRANFIRAFELGSAPLFMWAGAHDIYHPEFVKKLRLLLEANTQAVLAFSDSVFIDKEGRRHSSEPINEGPNLTQPKVEERFASACWNLHRCDMLHGLMRRACVSIKPMMRCAAVPDMAFLTSMTLAGHLIRQPELLFFRRKNRGEQTSKDVHEHLVEQGYITVGTNQEEMWEDAKSAISLAVSEGDNPQAVKTKLLATLQLSYHKRFGLAWNPSQHANWFEALQLKLGAEADVVASSIERRLMLTCSPSAVSNSYLAQQVALLSKENLKLKREIKKLTKGS
jgi:hypothetical protein